VFDAQAGGVSRDEVNLMKTVADRIFDIFDRNHNGAVDVAEFTAGMSLFCRASGVDKIRGSPLRCHRWDRAARSPPFVPRQPRSICSTMTEMAASLSRRWCAGPRASQPNHTPLTPLPPLLPCAHAEPLPHVLLPSVLRAGPQDGAPVRRRHARGGTPLCAAMRRRCTGRSSALVARRS
jgi:hypothetical protein